MDGKHRLPETRATPLTAAAAVAALLAGSALEPARAAEQGDFDSLAPEYDSTTDTVRFEGAIFRHRRTILVDLDGDGTKETTYQAFRSGENQRAGRLITRATVWGWVVHRDWANRDSQSDQRRNFTILDLDGSASPKFETKLNASEDIPLPSYLK